MYHTISFELFSVSLFINFGRSDFTSSAGPVVGYYLYRDLGSSMYKILTLCLPISFVLKKSGGPNSSDMAAEGEEDFTFAEDGEDALNGSDNVQVCASCHWDS